MNACRWEAAVLRAVREDQWPDDVRRHLLGCDDCVAAASVAPWMMQFSRTGDREHKLPDPSLLWIKAKLMQGSAEMHRAARPMTIVQLVAYAVVAGGWAAVLMWKWEAIEAWMKGLTPERLVTATTHAQSLSMSFFALILVLATMTAGLALHTIMAEDV